MLETVHGTVLEAEDVAEDVAERLAVDDAEVAPVELPVVVADVVWVEVPLRDAELDADVVSVDVPESLRVEVAVLLIVDVCVVEGLVNWQSKEGLAPLRSMSLFRVAANSAFSAGEPGLYIIFA